MADIVGRQKTSSVLGVIDRSRWQYLIRYGDNHDVFIDTATVNFLRKTIAERGKCIKIHLGDNWENKGLRDGADERDQNADALTPWETGLKFLFDVNDDCIPVGRHELTPDALTLGNHDWRWWKNLTSTKGSIRAYCQERIRFIEKYCKKFDVDLYRWGTAEERFSLYKTDYSHGYFSGDMAAKRMGNLCHRANASGHVHRFLSHIVDPKTGAKSVCTPSLCDNSKHEYQRGQEAATQHISGFGVDLIDHKKRKIYFGHVEKLAGRFIVYEPKVVENI